LSFPAIATVIEQVPVLAVIVTVPKEFTVQAVDDPWDHVKAPLVEPPVVDNDTVAP
jgi:hypothetical protein